MAAVWLPCGCRVTAVWLLCGCCVAAVTDVVARVGRSKNNKQDDDEYKTQNVNYYNSAHTNDEVVADQPTLMVNGTLKEYQVGSPGGSTACGGGSGASTARLRGQDVGILRLIPIGVFLIECLVELVLRNAPIALSFCKTASLASCGNRRLAK